MRPSESNIDVRVAVLWTSAHPAHMREVREAQALAPNFGISPQTYDVSRLADLEGAFAQIEQDRPQALLTFSDHRTIAYRNMIADFAAAHRLATIFSMRLFVDAGGMMSYGPNMEEGYHTAARYVDRVLKGAKPSDLPVELPTKCELVVNLKTAKGLGLTFPPSIMVQADEVIE